MTGTKPLQVQSWDQLAKHLGNDADSKRFRQTVRETWNLVSSVYPNANVDLSGKRVILHSSPAPLERKLVGSHLRLVGASGAAKAPLSLGGQGAVPLRAAKIPSGSPENLSFPSGSLRYGDREQKFRAIGLDKGKPYEVDMMADAFRKGFTGINKLKSEAEWLRVWESFVVRYSARRSPVG